jgi:hypothetical protein
VDPNPDLLLHRKSGSAGNRTGICSEKLRSLDHRGGLSCIAPRTEGRAVPVLKDEAAGAYGGRGGVDRHMVTMSLERHAL